MIYLVLVNVFICGSGGVIYDKFSYLLYFYLFFSVIKVLVVDIFMYILNG